MKWNFMLFLPYSNKVDYKNPPPGTKFNIKEVSCGVGLDMFWLLQKNCFTYYIAHSHVFNILMLMHVKSSNNTKQHKVMITHCEASLLAAIWGVLVQKESIEKKSLLDWICICRIETSIFDRKRRSTTCCLGPNFSTMLLPLLTFHIKSNHQLPR